MLKHIRSLCLRWNYKILSPQYVSITMLFIETTLIMVKKLHYYMWLLTFIDYQGVLSFYRQNI